MAKKHTAHVFIGEKSNGKPQYKYLAAETMRELHLMITYTMIEYGMVNIAEVKASAHNILFSEYILDWMETYKKSTISQMAYMNYMQQIKKHFIPYFGDMEMSTIDIRVVQNFFNKYDKYSLETQKKFKTVLNPLFNMAVEDGYMERNPFDSPRFKYTSTKVADKKALTVQEIQNICANIPNVKNEMDRRYLALLATTGMRGCEILGLRWKDIDSKNHLISINQDVVHPDRNQPTITTTKTVKSKRYISYMPEIEPYIKPTGDYNPEHLIFGGEFPYSYTRFEKMIKRIKGQVNLYGATGRIFRRTYLTDAYETTKDIKQAQDVAGHTTPSTTLKHYVCPRDVGTPEAAKKVSERYFPESAAQ